MKFYSEKLNKNFDTIPELEKAEADFDRESKAKTEAIKTDNHKTLKAELTNQLEHLEEALTEACNQYNNIKKEAKKILDKSEVDAAKIIEDANKQVEEMLKTPREKIKTLSDKRFGLITKYNRHFGPYRYHKEYNSNQKLDFTDWVDFILRHF